MKYIKRSQRIIETRGWTGFLQFFFSRLARISGDLVYEKSLAVDAGSNRVQAHPGSFLAYTAHVIDASNLHASQNRWLVRSIMQGENLEYLEGLQKNDCMVAVTHGCTVVHTSFVQFDTSYKKLLNENNDTPLIGNCNTLSSHRGQGLYPRAIAICCDEIASRGCQRILISCAPDNAASIAGIKKAGFVEIREVKTLQFLSKIYFQKVISSKHSKIAYRAGIL